MPESVLLHIRNDLSEGNKLYFQQDGALEHYHRDVSARVNRKFLNRWIRRKVPIEYPSTSPI